ncbi:unnamed protein product, partial [Amoebophrya sp. A25]|eukprot:GSA25T00019085001.1
MLFSTRCVPSDELMQELTQSMEQAEKSDANGSEQGNRGLRLPKATVESVADSGGGEGDQQLQDKEDATAAAAEAATGHWQMLVAKLDRDLNKAMPFYDWARSKTAVVECDLDEDRENLRIERNLRAYLRRYPHDGRQELLAKLGGTEIGGNISKGDVADVDELDEEDENSLYYEDDMDSLVSSS